MPWPLDTWEDVLPQSFSMVPVPLPAVTPRPRRPAPAPVRRRRGTPEPISLQNTPIPGPWAAHAACRGLGGSGAGVKILGGANNQLNNHGVITNALGVAGDAIFATAGNDKVDNYGLVSGSVDLVGGNNAFNNKGDATFNSGAVIHLGTVLSIHQSRTDSRMLRLAQLQKEKGGDALSIAVLEKAREAGAHQLSGALLDPSALSEYEFLDRIEVGVQAQTSHRAQRATLFTMHTVVEG